nr:transglycosylase domain-containing protein [uncultured Oscillibacter sp.]
MTRFDPKIRAEAVSLLKEVFVILEQHGRREQPSPQQPQRRRKSRKPSPVRIALGVVKWIFITLWTVLLIGVCTALVGLHFFKEYIDTVVTPNVAVRAEDYTMKLSSFIYYQDKETGSWKELQSVHGAENRILVEFKDMSPYLWQAAVSIEDERFFKHQGVDWKRTLGAVKELITGDGSYGGSTITQQVLKNMTKDNKPYVNRKVREIFRALEFEKNYGKEYILEQYLNDIYLGQGCYGVQTAAQFYFGKDAKDLSLAESACIIAITNNPSLYGPLYDVTYTREDGTKVTPRELNKNRQETILNKMCDENVINPETGLPYITKAQAEAAKAEVLQFADGSTSAKEIVEEVSGEVEINSWFVDKVIQDVVQGLQEEYNITKEEAYTRLYNSGYRIYTTLDPDIQALAESIYEDRSNLDVTSRNGQQLQSAITILDPYTADIVAMVGKVGEKQENLGWNCATAKRQVGSSMKPLTAYAPALDAGVITQGSVFDNYPVQELNGNPWPKNSPNTYTGFTTVRTGVQKSINTIAVQALQSVGVEEAYRFATENLNLGLVADDMVVGALGMGGLTRGLNTVEMAAAYACFANNGVYNEPRTYVRVTRVDNATGQEVTVLENEGESHVAMKETTAYLMTEMLKNAVTSGTGGQARFNGMHIAGKTGTTNDAKDRYFVGFTPYYVAAVWAGYEDPERISYSGNPAITMWKKVMEPLHMELPDKDFENKPATGLTTISVCLDSGMRPTDACRADPRGGRIASFTAASGTGPTEDCTIHKVVSYCTEGHCLAGETCPEAVVEQRAYLDYVREDYGPSIKAEDDAYLISTLEKAKEPSEANPTGGCPVHEGVSLPENPLDPMNPVDPNNPSGGTTTNPSEPYVPSPGESHEGYGPPPPKPDPTPEPDPVTPVEPEEPGTTDPDGGGGLFDDLWGIAM